MILIELTNGDRLEFPEAKTAEDAIKEAIQIRGIRPDAVSAVLTPDRNFDNAYSILSGSALCLYWDGINWGTEIVSHAKCVDGEAAAFAAWKKLDEEANYRYLTYYDELPDFLLGTSIVMVDYSRSHQELFALLNKGHHVSVIDHHESALIECLRLMATLANQGEEIILRSPLPPQGFDYATISDDEMDDVLDAHPNFRQLSFETDDLFINIDMDKSGAVLAWEHFHPEQPVPELLLLVQDRDLWKWELPFSQEFSEGLLTHLYELKNRDLCGQEAFYGFKLWDDLLSRPDSIDQISMRGFPLVEQRNAEVNELVQHAELGYVCGHEVPYCHAPKQRSWTGHRLCELYPDAPFSLTWKDAEEGIRTFDLRSNSGFNCRKLAKRKLGGGGHRPAAGFTAFQVAKLNVGDRVKFVTLDPLVIGGSDPWPEWVVFPDDKLVCSELNLVKEIDENIARMWTVVIKKATN